MKLKNLEIILATVILLFALTVIYSHGITYYSTVTQMYSEMGIVTLIYAVFMGFCMWIVPVYFRQHRIELGLVLTFSLFFLIWMALAGCLRLVRPNEVLVDFHGDGFAIATVIFSSCFAYEGIKRFFRHLKERQNLLVDRILKECLVVFGAGTLIFFLFMVLNEDLAALWLCAVPFSYALFAVSTYWLIPLREKKRIELMTFLLLALLVSFVLFVPFGMLLLLLAMVSGAVYYMTWSVLTIIVLPLSYYFFHRQKERIAQLVNLRVELGQTTAGLHVLRSQINPHFLFNILNTLYGTALQENAERTSTGIQKLGDMMRFMLHENNQDRILLAREIDYLANYIDLQKLRTAVSSEIAVDCAIEPAIGDIYIAPMLLIPFVENAFKHGISLQEKSWINISLKESDGILYFDVYNSIHRKDISDLEYKHSGLGLENVKQRLQLLYPERHDLVVRETAQEYFVHLTIQL